MWARGGLSGGGSCGERAAACGRRAYVPYPAVTALALAALAAATAARARRLEYRNRAQVPDPHDQATETGEMSHFDSRLDMSRRTCARLVMAHVLCSKCRFYGEARVQERKQKLLSRNLESLCRLEPATAPFRVSHRFPAVWENGQRACKGLLSRSASGARTHSQTVCALRSHHSITLLVACCFARRDGVAHAGAPTIPDGGRVGRRRVHRGSSRRTLNTDDVLMIH